MIRNTVDGRFGLSGASPAQSLARLADFNTAFPHLAIDLLGVSVNEVGTPVVWTVQPFVQGAHFADETDLRSAMVGTGWESIGDKMYRNKETGVVLADVHTGNVLVEGEILHPIDVIVTDLGTLRAQ